MPPNAIQQYTETLTCSQMLSSTTRKQTYHQILTSIAREQCYPAPHKTNVPPSINQHCTRATNMKSRLTKIFGALALKHTRRSEFLLKPYPKNSFENAKVMENITKNQQADDLTGS